MSKTAKEMFEELGYKHEILNYEGETIFYHNRKSYDGEEFNRIWFFLEDENYVVNSLFGSNNYVDKKLHQAIHQQMKELGWL